MKNAIYLVSAILNEALQLKTFFAIINCSKTEICCSGGFPSLHEPFVLASKRSTV